MFKHDLLFSLNLEGDLVLWGSLLCTEGQADRGGRNTEPSAQQAKEDQGPPRSPYPQTLLVEAGLAPGKRWCQAPAQVGLTADVEAGGMI